MFLACFNAMNMFTQTGNWKLGQYGREVLSRGSKQNKDCWDQDDGKLAQPCVTQNVGNFNILELQYILL